MTAYRMTDTPYFVGENLHLFLEIPSGSTSDYIVGKKSYLIQQYDERKSSKIEGSKIIREIRKITGLFKAKFDDAVKNYKSYKSRLPAYKALKQAQRNSTEYKALKEALEENKR